MKTIAVIRKPPESTVASNVLKHGCGGLHIDACRTSYEEGHVPPKDANIDKPSSWTSEEYNGDKPYILNAKLKTRQVYTPSGRYPANLILGPLAAEALDEQTREGGNMKTIAMTRKPLAGTVASNILEHGCGGLNIDASRIEYGERGPDRPFSQQVSTDQHFWGNASETLDKYKPSGRFPSNLILNEAAAESLDEQTKVSISTGGTAKAGQFASLYGTFSGENPESSAGGYGDAGGASRYFKIVEGDNVKTIAITRKTLEGTVVSNVLKHGCGGLNIDATRIKTSDSTIRTQHPQNNGGSMNDGELKGGTTGSENGRWPANLILKEDVAESLDEQSIAGGMHSAGSSREASRTAGKTGMFPMDGDGHRFGDSGGASRFFKNVKEDLVSYLRDMITPPEGVVKVVPLDIIEPTGEDESVHGFIVMGTPTSDQCEELLRICKPGAHVLLIAPEEQPTGHTGMCRMEDAGFEIRDTILLLLEAGGFWYIPKPSRSERDAGCHKLRVPGHEAVNRKEGSKGLESPRAGAGRTANKVGNSHPTVKPFAIMQALMEGQEGPVVDPFMGSGSTGIAAVHTGHDFIGIEREEDYLKIADARVRHWADSEWRGRMTEVVSDLEQEPETEPEVMDLGSLFGMGGSE